MVLAQKRHLDKWNKIESPEINPCTHHELIYERGGKITQGWEDKSLQQMVQGKLVNSL